MTNITLSVDEEIARKAERAAAERHTTLVEMVRQYLTGVAATDADKARRLAALEESFERLSRNQLPRRWRREDLYDRPVFSRH